LAFLYHPWAHSSLDSSVEQLKKLKETFFEYHSTRAAVMFFKECMAKSSCPIELKIVLNKKGYVAIALDFMP
jgi:hypothetical protein